IKRNSMRKRFSILTLSVLVFVALFLGMQINSVISGDNIFVQLNKFKDVLSMAEKFYVDEIDTQKLVESAINGMLSELDPHSVYIPASQLPKINEDFQGSFEGIGVEYDVINDTLLVVAPVSGGPSEALGILAGDKIVKINDTSSIGIKREDVPKKLRGPKGTHVKVAIYRPGEKDLFEFDITRDKIPLYSVDVSYMINDKVGYVNVNRFSQTTHDEFVSALNKLRSQGMKKLILDLRNNSGGYLEQAYKMADELLPKGKKIVYTKGRRPEFNEDYTSAGGNFTDISLIILVNPGSASASEIVSGAVQDWDRGLIVGETTFGKGLVQRQLELSDKSAVRLTIARYYTPSGRLIQRPYGKDMQEYRKAALDKEEQEGDNIEHQREGDSTKPIFATASGRKVYGGGGITPDYIIKAERLTSFSVQLRSKGVFAEHKTAYLDRNGRTLRQQYEKDLKRFLSDFKVTDEMLDDLEAIAKKKGVTIEKDQFDKDRRFIKTLIKSEIAYAIWGNEGRFRVYHADDAQLQKALTLFPEADKIFGSRQ
ncbi:MAG TPA: S41 family peptidase, partial [Bacteroidota bacterium]|nr:S41 family peptidase [Bacteroidota bacterium]